MKAPPRSSDKQLKRIEHNTALVGRQSIYDRKLNVYAYELLYRPAAGQNFAPSQFDGNKATSEVMLNTFLEIGLENIVAQKRAFINMTEQFVDGSIDIPLPIDSIVIEVLEEIKPTPNVIKGLQDLKNKGYMIALDDFVFDEELMPLVPFADIIKVDLLQISQSDLKKHVIALRQTSSVKLLAEKVETEQEFEFCKDLGFDYYQGYFLEKPVIIEGKKMPANKLAILQLISRLQDPKIDIDEIQALIKTDVSLSYKVLRYINSPGFNLDIEVTSIKQALVLLGLNTLKHWVTLAVISGLSDKSVDIIQKVLTRAKMCEIIAGIIGQKNQEDFFLVGMFSMLDVMMDQKMEIILSSIPIRQSLKDAILTHKGKEGKVLCCVIAYDHGYWEMMKSGSISFHSLRDAYLSAISWADQTLAGIEQ